ncbi:glycosyltransferase family 20 protein [Lophiostoma macrostomum CBS 122681]|uniref:Glycosyltransferase family 20 protein n=1 Tax=Lophiostoma macrostomum CBS 122681 TaxID=1314788 RepID=A0A6A6T0G5_9PLEO|nr:glycosyltransferase family 20 protein [Lophiostoma macrostomum CBS 122681]
MPDWGNGLYFNQPRSNAEPPLPDTILAYGKVLERAEAQKGRLGRKISPRSRNISRDHSADPRWATSWAVVPGLQGNGGLTNAIRASIDAGALTDVLAVGSIGFPTDVLDDQKKTEIYEKLESEHDSLIVYVSDSDLDGHYAHYCKTILWPVFHYQIPDHPKSKAYEDHSWVYYVNVNQAFADKVIANYKRGDIIWVHDYHLCLVPGMIRKKLPDAQIGFFLHTAFPSSEVFRCLATRKDILDGLLGANLVAFQTPEYAHHFLQTCSRILSIEATADGVQLENHFVNVWSLPIGVDPKAISLEREGPAVQEWINALQERYAGKRVIVARDKLDSIRGVRQKLLAFELFLNKYPEWRDKVVLIQVATSTTENDDLAVTVSEIVTRIDAVHSTLAHNPLVFLRQDIAFSQYLALLTVADALMITSLREGMNLTCHEFVICQDGKASEKKHGPVILSEFTGSAAIFDGAELGVNPWDYQKCAEAIKVALEMGEAEKERRYAKMRDVVMRNTGDYWTRTLSEHLSKVHEEHFRRDTMSIPRLNVTKLCQTYQACKKRLFFIDYEGTLAPFGSVSKTVLTNTERVTDVLNELISDDNNVVYVMAGRTLEELEMLFGRVPGIGLIAENGCYYREMYTDEWTAFADEEKTKKWKDAVKSILQYYIERVEGSWVEERHCSLTFHYEKADGYDSADRQAGDCANHINDACENQRVKAVPTKDSVIIEPMDWDKGSAASYIINNIEKEKRPDWLMVAGNDRDDEVIFRWANQLHESGEVSEVSTVSVGNRNTVAMSTLTQGTTGKPHHSNVLNYSLTRCQASSTFLPNLPGCPRLTDPYTEDS